MKKRLLAIISAFVMAFCCAFFVACEDETETGGQPGQEQGNEGGDQGGSTGGNQGGSTGGDQGGSTGGDQGGSTGGNQGGSTGGDQGGSTGGDQGGSTGGDQGGSTGGDQGGSTGGDQGGDVTEQKIAVYAVSNVYDSAEKAIKGYIDNELSGESVAKRDIVNGFGMEIFPEEEDEVAVFTITATYGSHESKGAASISDFGFTSAQKTGLLSVEKFIASLSLAHSADASGAGDTASAVTDAQTVTQTIYIAKYGDAKFSYVVAAPAQGERIPNSVFHEVASFSRYENCEMRMTTESLTSAEDTEGTFAKGHILKISQNAAYYAITYNSREDFDSGRYASEEYSVEDGDQWKLVSRESTGSTEWTPDDSCDSLQQYGYYRIYDAAHLGVVAAYPAAMFTATESGFTCELRITETGYFQKSGVTVTDGKITGISCLLDWGDGDIVRVRVTFGSFGTTTVTVPPEVLAAVNH